jgi:hypothetical protein
MPVSEYMLLHAEATEPGRRKRWLRTVEKDIVELWTDGVVVYCRWLT